MNTQTGHLKTNWFVTSIDLIIYDSPRILRSTQSMSKPL